LRQTWQVEANAVELRVVEHTPVRVGVVGCGVVADYGHIPAIHRLPEAELVAFADPDVEHREKQAAKYGLPCFASFEEMVQNVELDAVSIPTQPGIKLAMIRIAAAHGLHAFCEKPLTETAEDAEELMRLMDGAGLFVGVAFVYRGKQIVQRMMELVRQGAIGRLRAVMIENLWDYHGLRDQAVRGDRRRRNMQNLGTLDCGVHHLDLARYMAGGEYTDIQAVGTVVEAVNTYPDHIMMNARMDNGVVVSVLESGVWGYTAKERPRYEQSYRLVGGNGVLAAQLSGGRPGRNGAELMVVSGQEQWTEELGAGKAWDETYRQFFQIIRGHEVASRFIADGHDALVNMKVAREVIARSRDAGRSKG
jgi:predicted dehydrogenase